MIKTIVFDIGNVVWAYEPLQKKLFTAWAKLLNTNYQTFYQQYFHFYQYFETNDLTLSDYFLSQNLDPKPFLNILHSTYSPSNFRKYLIKDTLSLISDLKKIGYQVGYLSNAENYHYPLIHQRLDHYFDFGITSWQAKIRKPDPKIFAEIFKYTSALPSEVLFIDDIQENVISAKNYGLQAIHFQNSQKLLSDLTLIPNFFMIELTNEM
jgi:putative hydrolase of the HAD superfamily